ncbi:MAG: tRNA uridine-5-carboxymethylaminomethyl(34) synthesis enzyme MnmG [Omnitrophica bacterium GWA2_52_8]|nr:MAG: tRNA uridine-5-carboxymethylaminomethyl(34) synthesis enzyme MnmG [Omnitrophica bacterium GWA2_52_8]
MNPKLDHYHAIIVGAGHAGVEAALAISRAGFKTLVLTMDTQAIARMSCNPAIGGLAKGHAVREIDALGGEMAKATDATGIQFRMLNESRGPAVRAPRAQADKKQYSLYMEAKLAAEPNLELRQAHVTGLIVENGRCAGVRTQDGTEIKSFAVVLTTGTFLQGLIHVGETHVAGGRVGEKPAVGLSDSLRKNGIQLIRFKTGTPPRLHADSIPWQELEPQPGDEPPRPFSFSTEKLEVDQLPCYLTYTSEKTHDVIRRNLHRSPLYGGKIKSAGPRDCPSIEDKVVKFADKSRHQIYLEPEGRDTKSIYVNGMSTSLPRDVQEEMVRSVRGLEHAQFLRYGYAIEYDCAPPTQLKHSLETKQIENLFLAGQINCTSGYEEAAGQGLMAGLNVVRKLRGEGTFVLDRSEAYIGVLIDDLVTRGTNEPYRLFTARAEYRLLLRQDNADKRLMKYGYEFGLVAKNQYEKSNAKHEKICTETETLKSKWHRDMTLDRYLRRPGVTCKDLIAEGLYATELDSESIETLEAEIKYEGYISRQAAEVKRFKRMESKPIPEGLDFRTLHGLSSEAREKLAKICPASIGQASRIPGLKPSDLSLLAVHVERTNRERGQK